MAVKYQKAKEGYKFALTPDGLNDSRIRAKYEENAKMRKRYECSVPITWIEQGLITEVKA